jgi:hypothetical protein
LLNLDAIDTRMSLLREINATLEAIARALFKSWLIDFDPVGARSQVLLPAGRAKPRLPCFWMGSWSLRWGRC